jgi:hypothetical protein
MASKLDMINQALVLVGDAPLTSLTEDRRAQVVANQIYDTIIYAELSKHRWGFAKSVVLLSQTTNTPINTEYKYEYQLPSDLIKEIRIIPLDYRYIRYSDKLYSNVPNLKMEYIKKVTEDFYPEYFERAVVYALARDLSIAIRDQMDRFQAMDLRYKEEARNARTQDAQAYPQTPMVDMPTVTTRY